MKALIASFASALALLICGSAHAEGSIHNHMTLDLIPISLSANNPVGSGVGLSYDHYHDALRTAYSLGAEASIPYSSAGRIDGIATLGAFTEITRAFSLGGRAGVVFNNPGAPVGFGALGLRLPALYPEAKEFFSFFFEELDLGIAGSGDRYAGFRLGMLLL